MTAYDVQQVSPVVTHHGEGPVWLGSAGLAVLDMLAGDCVLLDAAGGPARRVHVSDVLAAIRPRRGGGYVAGIERGFCLLDADFAIERTTEAWSDPSVRMNEGACDPAGRFWCGSMAYDLTPGAAAMWRLAADGGVGQVFGDVGGSNGLAWTRDGQRAYYVDSLTERIDVLEGEGDELRRAPFADVAGEGFPDGLAVDADGGVWLALFGSGRLLHFDADGNRSRQVSLPVRQVTSCGFGGEDFRTLYITTSRFGLDDPEPQAGAVFAIEPAVGGFPVFGFAG